MFHIPQTYNFDEMSRRRKELEIEAKIKQIKNLPKTITDTAKSMVDEQSKKMKSDSRVEIAKQVVKLLPEPTGKQQLERKKNREKMQEQLFLPVQRPSPNTSELSDLEIGKARIIKASTIFHDSTALNAQEYLDSDPRTKGWKIDTELSNKDHLVVYKGDDVKVAFRGTKWRTGNWKQDLATNVANVGNEDMRAQQNMNGKQLITEIESKYGERPSELLGYSKGGNTSLNLGDIFDIPSTAFNPSIGPRQMRTSSKVAHTIINTVDDPVSVMSYFKKKPNYTIKRIRSIRGENPVAQHKLSNFTQRGNNQPSGLERMSHELIGKGQNLGHVETYDAMRHGVETGKTFTETLDEFNRTNGNAQRVDVTADGGLGERIHSRAPTVRYWLDAGGKFTPREEAHLRMQTVPKHTPVSEEARAMGINEGDTILPSQKAIMNRSQESRSKFVSQKRSDFKQSVDALNTKANTVHESFKAAMPTTEGLGAGLVTGFAADKTIDSIDPDHKLGQVGDEAAKGALSGAGAAAILGTAAAPEAIAGGAAWVAGSESGKAIAKATHSEAAGDTLGGAIGGATAVATAGVVGAGVTVGAAVAGGAELGTALGSVVPGVGNLIGLGVGATLGAAIGGIGYLFSHHWW